MTFRFIIRFITDTEAIPSSTIGVMQRVKASYYSLYSLSSERGKEELSLASDGQGDDTISENAPQIQEE